MAPAPTKDRTEMMIEARGLSKRYGDVAAVQGVDFEIGKGEVSGISSMTIDEIWAEALGSVDIQRSAIMVAAIFQVAS